MEESHEAEDRRVTRLATLLGILLGCILILGVWTAHISHESCKRVAGIDMVIQQQGNRGLQTLGQKGGVGFAYYQAHPAELALARAQLTRQINDFTPIKCSGIF